MLSTSENFYAAWRTPFAADIFNDKSDAPSERLLQLILQHQRLKRAQLRTSEGKTIRIFHPGFVSVEGGPDFRDAIVQIDGESSRVGDVEIDLRADGWRAHGHDRNLSFKNVILHVVWKAAGLSSPPKKKNRPSVVALEGSLDAPLHEIGLSLENEPLRSLPENLRGKCSAPLHELPEARLTELLHAAAKTRFENKAATMLARAKHSGWEQALWESLFCALGYKHNVWPMQNLAEAKPRWMRGVNSSFEIQARLLGVSGLLPAELTGTQKNSDTFLRRAWDVWWRERDEFEDCLLPRTAWKFHGLRPANHPQRRLALASHWVADKHFISKIENWCAAHWPDKKLLDSLHEVFQIKSDDFWSWHWTFKSALLAKPQPLLGEARVTDLAVNVILPWLWVRAREGGNKNLQGEIERRFFLWPAAEDNSVLKLARQRLLGAGKTRALRTAAAQQGLMQIVRDFCGHSNAVCAHCHFPDLVRNWDAAKII